MKGFHQKQRVLVVGVGTLAQALEKSFSPSGIRRSYRLSDQALASFFRGISLFIGL